MYEEATRRHGQKGKDVVHDLYVKFAGNTPPDAYTRTCIHNSKPDPIAALVDVSGKLEDGEPFDEQLYVGICRILSDLRVEYEIEVDTFLACRVNGDLKTFSREYGVSRTVLEKICNFVKNKILTEYEFNRKSN